MRNNTTYNKDLITWTGLASSAEVTFIIPVLHEKGHPGVAIFIERLEAMRMSSVLPATSFSLGSFARPPGKRDYLKNFHPGSRHHWDPY